MKNTHKFGLLLTLIAFNVYAGNDICPLDDKGNVVPANGYQVSSIKNSNGKDILTLTPDASNPFGGPALVWVVTKDSQGRVTRIESGGDKPSQKLIDFENKNAQQMLVQNALVRKNAKRSFSIPDAQSFRMALATPEDIPVKFGAVVEMAHVNKNCNVTKLAERVYDQKQKRVLEQIKFSADRCLAINNLHQKFNKDIAECSEKYRVHEVELAALVTDSTNIANVTTGVGGGGGSPIRSIASVVEIESNPFDSLIGRYQSSLEAEKEMCDFLKPEVAGSPNKSQTPASKSATRQ